MQANGLVSAVKLLLAFAPGETAITPHYGAGREYALTGKTNIFNGIEGSWIVFFDDVGHQLVITAFNNAVDNTYT